MNACPYPPSVLPWIIDTTVVLSVVAKTAIDTYLFTVKVFLLLLLCAAQVIAVAPLKSARTTQRHEVRMYRTLKCIVCCAVLCRVDIIVSILQHRPSRCLRPLGIHQFWCFFFFFAQSLLCRMIRFVARRQARAPTIARRERRQVPHPGGEATPDRRSQVTKVWREGRTRSQAGEKRAVEYSVNQPGVRSISFFFFPFALLVLFRSANADIILH